MRAVCVFLLLALVAGGESADECPTGDVRFPPCKEPRRMACNVTDATCPKVLMCCNFPQCGGSFCWPRPSIIPKQFLNGRRDVEAVDGEDKEQAVDRRHFTLVCPTVPPAFFCFSRFNLCVNDASCFPPLRCCFDGCRNRCLFPDVTLTTTTVMTTTTTPTTTTPSPLLQALIDLLCTLFPLQFAPFCTG